MSAQPSRYRIRHVSGRWTDSVFSGDPAPIESQLDAAATAYGLPRAEFEAVYGPLGDPMPVSESVTMPQPPVAPSQPAPLLAEIDAIDTLAKAKDVIRKLAGGLAR